MPPEPNGWNEWGKHVLLELERNDTSHGRIEKALQTIHTEIAMLKVKSGIWGLIGGTIPVFIMICFMWFKSLK